MLNTIRKIVNSDAASVRGASLVGAITLIVYLTARNSGLYPMVFADEWLYNAYSRYMTVDASPRPSYLFYYIYGVTNYCGEAFLDCARQLNVLFFGLSIPLIYSVCRKFAPPRVSLIIAIFSVFSPINSYSAYFMPESMNFFFFWAFTYFVVAGFDAARPSLMAAGAGLSLACMALVKPHAIFLFPALFLTFLSTWMLCRNMTVFRHVCRLAIISTLSFLVLRLALGYSLAGEHGLSMMGSDYGGIASSMSGFDYLVSLLPLASYNLFGHLLALSVLFGVPIALILLQPIDGLKNRSVSDRKHFFLQMYSGSLTISLIVIVSLFAAKAVSMGPYESIERLSMRHYNYIFPLFLIIATSSLYITKTASGMCWRLAAVAIFIAYAAWSRFSGFVPNLIDSPEMLAVTKYKSAYIALAFIAFGCLLLTAYRRNIGTLLYLFLFFPITIILSSVVINKDFSKRLVPDVYDQAGQFTSRYLGKETGNLVIFGPDLSSLYRTHFYMTSPETLFFAVPEGQLLDVNLIPEGKQWLLLIGNYKHQFVPSTTIQIPVKSANGKLLGEYTLMRISYATRLEIVPNQDTLHQVGKFDKTSNSLVAPKGESGALIFGPYARLEPGRYEAEFLLVAEGNVVGASIGSLDVSGYIPPNKEAILAQVPLKAAFGEQIIKIPFDARNSDYEYQFRVWLNGDGNKVSIKSINVRSVDK